LSISPRSSAADADGRRIARMRIASASLLTTVDLAGTFVFAVEGAMTAIAAELDLLGVMVLAFATALCGGMTRDVLIGASPPQALRDWRYAVTAFIGGAVAFAGHSLIRRIPPLVILDLDAAGLTLFAVAGTEKALAYRMPALIAVLMGGITAVGGGSLRDMLLTRVPAVLRIDVYATAALAGSAVMVAARRLGLSPTWSAAIGGLVCFGLRAMAIRHHWSLPRAAEYHW
jgi:uncharacterized membrane protein YeiH